MQGLENETSEHRIRFILDGSVISVSDVSPDLTLLQYLRENLHRSGTKEGCAEGDCGACTVVVGELVNDRVRLRNLNACIQFLPMLNGKALFTVESLKTDTAGHKLHPVQQAMVDCHGSQCGFCTSGFVMSLFVLFKNIAEPSRAQINDYLSGNLCRCTGYRPIIEAATKMSQYAGRKWIDQPASSKLTPPDDDEQELIQLLKQIKPTQTLHIKNNQKHYAAPLDLNEFAQLRDENPQATLVAGNTDIGLWVNKQGRELPLMISLDSVAELKQIKVTDSDITIAAGVSLTDAVDVIVQYYPQLQEFFMRFASRPIRNAGTLVGNVANGSPIGDSIPILIALQAELNLRKGDSQRVMPLDEFYLGYQQKNLQAGEFVVSIKIPRNLNQFQLASYKVSKRYDQDISAVCAAFVLDCNEEGIIQHCRLVYGGMAATASRARNTEEYLQGQVWNAQTVQTAQSKLTEDFSALSDMRASSGYRHTVAKNLLQRFYLQTQSNLETPAVFNLELSEVVS